MMKKNLMKLVALGCAVATLLTGCGSAGDTAVSESTATASSAATSSEAASTEAAASTETEAEGEPKYGGTLNVAIGSVSSLDPMFESADEPAARHIFETVLSLDEQNVPRTGVCSYEVSDDNLTITLTVRDGITFHDGDPVTADDVAASLKRWTANISNGKTNLAPYLAEDGIVVVDDKTVELKLTSVASAALAAMGYEYMGAFVYKQEACEAFPDSAITDESMLIGTGPYKFEEWVTDSYVKVSRYDGYVQRGNDCAGPAGDKYAYCDEINFYFMTDNDAKVNAILTGEIDLTRNVSYSTYESLQSDDSVKFFMIDDGTKPALVFNKDQGPASDPKFREAVLCAIDMNAVMLGSFGSEELYTLTGSWAPKGTVYEVDNDKYYEYDVEKAKEILAESSYNGETVVYITQSSGYYYTTALLVTQMMQEIGINVELQTMDQATLYTVRKDPTQFDIYAVGFTAKADPAMIAFLADSFPGLWVSDAKTEIIDKMAVTMDQDEKVALWSEMTDLIYEEIPAITFGERKNCTLATARVMDATYEGSEPYYWNVWINE